MLIKWNVLLFISDPSKSHWSIRSPWSFGNNAWILKHSTEIAPSTPLLLTNTSLSGIGSYRWQRRQHSVSSSASLQPVMLLVGLTSPVVSSSEQLLHLSRCEAVHKCLVFSFTFILTSCSEEFDTSVRRSCKRRK